MSRRNIEGEDLSKFSGEEVELKLENLISPEESRGGSEILGPEKIKQIWDGLSDTEKRFVISKDTVFNSVIDKYEQEVGKQKATVLRALRKLVLSRDPRASLIENEIGR